jgi:arsenate reductase (glutaredoxin)
MSVILFGIPNCDTVKKARVWLDGRGIAYCFHDYKKAGVDPAELARWCDVLGWENVINRSGTTFRKLADADKADLTRTRAIALMLAQPGMIRRPIVEHEGGLLLGFKEAEWAAAFA